MDGCDDNLDDDDDDDDDDDNDDNDDNDDKNNKPHGTSRVAETCCVYRQERW